MATRRDIIKGALGLLALGTPKILVPFSAEPAAVDVDTDPPVNCWPCLTLPVPAPQVQGFTPIGGWLTGSVTAAVVLDPAGKLLGYELRVESSAIGDWDGCTQSPVLIRLERQGRLLAGQNGWPELKMSPGMTIESMRRA